MGPPSVLSVDKENQIVNWILSNAKVGFPVHPEQLKDSVQSVLKESPKQNNFINNRQQRRLQHQVNTAHICQSREISQTPRYSTMP